MFIAIGITSIFTVFVYLLCSYFNLPFPLKWENAFLFFLLIIIGGSAVGLLLTKMYDKNKWPEYTYWSTHCFANFVIYLNTMMIYTNIDNPDVIGEFVANLGTAVFAVLLYAEVFLKFLKLVDEKHSGKEQSWNIPWVSVVLPIWMLLPIVTILDSLN